LGYAKNKGYTFEVKIQDFFNLQKGWKSKRLAPSSTSLPDVMVTYKNNLFAIEAKATSSFNREVPYDQLENSSKFLELLPLYDKQYVGACWYFSRKGKDRNKKTIKRKIVIHTILWDNPTFLKLNSTYGKIINNLTCDYLGDIKFHFNFDPMRKRDQLMIEQENYMNQRVKTAYPYRYYETLDKLVSAIKFGDSLSPKIENNTKQKKLY